EEMLSHAFPGQRPRLDDGYKLARAVDRQPALGVEHLVDVVPAEPHCPHDIAGVVAVAEVAAGRARLVEDRFHCALQFVSGCKRLITPPIPTGVSLLPLLPNTHQIDVYTHDGPPLVVVVVRSPPEAPGPVTSNRALELAAII